MFLSSADIFFKINFFENVLSGIPSVLNSLDTETKGGHWFFGKWVHMYTKVWGFALLILSLFFLNTP